MDRNTQRRRRRGMEGRKQIERERRDRRENDGRKEGRETGGTMRERERYIRETV